MASFKFFRKIGSALSAGNATTDEVGPNDLSSCTEVTYYIVFGAATSAGAVQVESAHVPAYSGTWAAEGSPTAWVAATRVHKVSITGISNVARARVSTAIVGGTVDIYAMGN